MTPEQKQHIDGMNYQEMLRLVRFEPIGSDNAYFFKGTEICTYFMEQMRRKRVAVGPAGHTAASKAIGWEKITGWEWPKKKRG